MGEPVVFGTSFEALLLRGLPRPPGPAASARLAEAGVDLGKPLLPAYALSTWVRTLAVVAEDAFPGEPAARAYEGLGRAIIRGLQQLPTGKAAHEKNVTLGVHRALERMTRSFRISNNYLETTLTPRGPGAYGLELKVVPEFLGQVEQQGLPPPAFYLGVFAQTLESWGAREVQVALEADVPAPRAYRYGLRFAEPG